MGGALENDIILKVLNKLNLDRNKQENIMMVTMCKLVDDVTGNINKHLAKQSNLIIALNDKMEKILQTSTNDEYRQIDKDTLNKLNKIQSLQEKGINDINCMDKKIE